MFRATFLAREAYGFIGLGQMGSRMCPNLWKDKNCTDIYIYDTNASAMKDIQSSSSQGRGRVIICNSPAEVASHCNKIITMLPNVPIVNDVYCNIESGIFSTIKRGSVLVDSSTVSCDTPRNLAKIAADKGCVFADAPVSGGVMAAQAGALTFMVGGGKDFDVFKAFLTPLAKAVVCCGEVGTGQAAKLANNMVLSQHMIAISEGMLLGTKLGVCPKVLAGIFNGATARCWSSDTYNPYPGVMEGVPSANDYNGGFGCSLMLKDIGLAIEAARTVGMVPRGGGKAYEIYSEIVNDKDMAKKDFSCVIQYLNGGKV